MSERIFIDTHVMLDLLGRREPFYEPIAKIATLEEKKTYYGGLPYFFRHGKLVPFQL